MARELGITHAGPLTYCLLGHLKEDSTCVLSRIFQVELPTQPLGFSDPPLTKSVFLTYLLTVRAWKIV